VTEGRFIGPLIVQAPLGGVEYEVHVLGRLALLFIIVPIVELLLLIRMGQWIGLLPTLGLIVATGLGGAFLARREGWRALKRFGASVAMGEVPTDAALDGLAVLVGGAFLLTPGVLTDVVGFGLLLPPIRAIFKRRVVSGIKARVASGGVQFLVYGPMAGGWRRPAGPGGGEDVGDGIRASDPPRPGEIVVPPPGEGHGPPT
jgi:UPF0716 protein FxsA